MDVDFDLDIDVDLGQMIFTYSQQTSMFRKTPSLVRVDVHVQVDVDDQPRVRILKFRDGNHPASYGGVRNCVLSGDDA